MKTITFYSYKGGVGRSLILANVAKRLTELGKNVCMLDFDLEAPGLEYKFIDYKYAENKKGVVDFINSYTEQDILVQEITDYTSDIKIASRKHHGWLKLFPAGDIVGPSYWKKLMSIDWKKMFYTTDGKGFELILHLKALIEQQVAPDYLLVDSRTGISEISGITLSILADEVVVVAANNDENIIGSALIMRSIKENTLNTNPKVHFVLSRVPFTNTPEDREKEFDRINELKVDFSLEGLDIQKIHIIHSDRKLEEEETLRIGEVTKDGEISIENDYLTFFDDVIKPDLLFKDVTLFENVVKAKRLLLKAIETDEIEEKLKLLNQSIELDSENDLSYFERSQVLQLKGKIEEAENDILNYYKYSRYKSILTYYQILKFYKDNKLFLKLIAFSKSNPIDQLPIHGLTFKTLSEVMIGEAFTMIGENGIALNHFSKLLKVQPDMPIYNLYFSQLHYKKGDLITAEDHIDRAIKYAPNYSDAFYLKSLIKSATDSQEDFYLLLNRALESDTTSETKNKIATEPEFKKYYNEEAFQRIIYKYNIRLKTEE